MKIVSWNVNGLARCKRNGFLKFLADSKAEGPWLSAVLEPGETLQLLRDNGADKAGADFLPVWLGD